MIYRLQVRWYYIMVVVHRYISTGYHLKQISMLKSYFFKGALADSWLILSPYVCIRSKHCNIQVLQVQWHYIMEGVHRSVSTSYHLMQISMLKSYFFKGTLADSWSILSPYVCIRSKHCNIQTASTMVLYHGRGPQICKYKLSFDVDIYA